MNGMSNGMMMYVRGLIGAIAGIAFGGKRDYYKVFGWNSQPSHRDFLAKYIRQDITQRVINAPVKGTWTDAPIIEGGTAFDAAWKKVVEDSSLFYHVSRADIFAGLGAFSILVIGLDDGRKLETPANEGRDNKITYLQPYLEGSVEIIEFDENPNSKRFGKPVMYRVKPGENILDRRSVDARLRQKTQFTVHWSRVLHIADNTLENTIFGHSRLESIFNLLDDILKVSGGSAETYWLTANRGMQVDVDKDMELQGDDADNLAEEIDEYEHGLRRILRTRGVKVNNLGTDVADPKNTFGVQMALLSSNTGIPQRVLMGAEAGQLASQQDRANWANTLAERVALFAEPVILRPLLERFIALRIVPTPATLKISWPEPFKMNPLERAQTSAQQARSITNVARALETAQKMKVKFFSIEEGRMIVAPGDKVLVMNEKPQGTTFPPELTAPVAEPKNKEIEQPALNPDDTPQQVTPPTAQTPTEAPPPRR